MVRYFKNKKLERNFVEFNQWLGSEIRKIWMEIQLSKYKTMSRWNESTPLDKPVTHITRPAKGAVDDTCGEAETGDIWSNGWRSLIEVNEDENNLEHPLPLTISTLPSPPITATTKTVNNFGLSNNTFKTKVFVHHQPSS